MITPDPIFEASLLDAMTDEIASLIASYDEQYYLNQECQ